MLPAPSAPGGKAHLATTRVVEINASAPIDSSNGLTLYIKWDYKTLDMF